MCSSGAFNDIYFTARLPSCCCMKYIILPEKLLYARAGIKVKGLHLNFIFITDFMNDYALTVVTTFS